MSDDLDLNRRAFLKASGLTAAGLAFGAGSAAAAASGDAFAPEFANWRVREVRKVWEMGYTGRQDRPLGLTDSGVDALLPSDSVLHDYLRGAPTTAPRSLDRGRACGRSRPASCC